jgi:subtilisin family serine protease
MRTATPFRASRSLISFTLLIAVLLVALPGATPAAAQTDFSDEERHKLGLRLQPVVEPVSAAKSTGAARRAIAAEPFRSPAGLSKREGEPTYAVFVHTSRPEAIRQTGAAVDSRFSGFVTARTTPSQLRAIAQLESVEQIRASNKVKLHNDEAAAFVGARALNNGFVEGTEYTGEGVIACVIDSGIDYDHPDFIDSTGSSRIISIWDQTFDTQGQTPSDRHSDLFGSGSLDYGTEYHTSEIESGGLQTKDTDGHGTHVAGTVGASGNADPAGKYKGMAPGVNFIVVRPGSGTSPLSSNAVDALRFCDAIADDKGRPMVANKSLGLQAGPHDGTSEWALAIDQVLDDGSASGRAVAVSAGNDGGQKIHVKKVISASTSKTVGIEVPNYEPEDSSGNDRLAAQLWLGRDAQVSATVTTPNGSVVRAAPGETKNDMTTNDGQVSVSNGVYPGNGDRVIELVAADPTESNTPSSGTWSVELTNSSGSSVTVDGWIAKVASSIDPQKLAFVDGDTQSTVGIPGTATHAITVGSFMHRWRWHASSGTEERSPDSENRSADISAFSSEGPRRDGTTGAYKPEITAPGQSTISSLSQDSDPLSSYVVPGGMHKILQGTSMSAPVVAGSVALLLEEDPTLTAQKIKDLITQTADSDDFTGTTPNTEWGYGRLDILEAMTKVVDPSASGSFTIFANGGHPDASFEEYTRLGGTGVDAHAVRFTPQQEGRLSGAYFHLHYPSANDLSAPLTVEIRRDDGGIPGPQVGSAASISPDRLQTGTWNYQYLAAATDVTLSASQDYYLVYYPSKPDESVKMMLETYSASGNTFYLDSGGWQQGTTADLLVRPVVSNLSGLTELPVELAAFGATTSGRTVRLKWKTASETGNAAFEVQQKEEGSSWSTLGRVEGAGTTTKPQTYTYQARDVGYGEHSFRLRQIDRDGSTTLSKEVTAVVEPAENLAVETYPNPVSSQATVRVAAGEAQDLSVEVYDLLGRQVARLYEGEVVPSQPKTIRLESSNFSSGTYFLRVQGEAKTKTSRLTIVK